MLPPPPPPIVAPAWPDTPVARLEALAMLQSLELALVTQDSATLVLDDWCARHHLAPPGTKIVADRQFGANHDAPADVRASLHVSADTPLNYRLVHLRCGERVMSIAENWYVPARLTAEMNRALDNTDTSFGRVVRPLGFRRTTLASRLLWSPLGEDWSTIGDGTANRTQVAQNLTIPSRVIENRAVLVLPDGAPFAYVIENYTAAVLAAPPPALGR
ncbi:hypothetical protein [Sphingomonas sp. GC_Shp_3]|uniref:hypothetical protein n=1 Tax=Sphingomonas sp. GC_Shp_3 TaxID=2937383 RepID=UPI00226AAF4D|nr:hypothetical protein [Sphingomonas sp. GC_Shp_3]